MALRPLVVITVLLAGHLAASPAAADDPPKVVASIAPVHSLAAGVMAGIAMPDLLVQGYGSPHIYQMRPSEARTLAAADLVLWIGEPLETFLVGPIDNLSADARVISLLEADGVDVHAAREGGLWEEHHEDEDDHAADHEDDHEVGHQDDHEVGHQDDHEVGHEDDHEHDHGSVDPHIWLSPDNAMAMVDAIAAALGEADADRAALYAANGAAVKARLDRLARDVEASLAGVADRPFIMFHDSLLYFEHAFGLTGVGAVAADPDRQPGAATLRGLRRRMAERGVRCVLVEPQFTPVLVETLIEGTAVSSATVDPLGAGLALGPDAYFDMMTSNATSLARCLGAPAGD